MLGKQAARIALILALALWTAACGAPATAPPPSATPAAGAAKPAWEVEWDKVSEAARKEKLVMNVQPGEDWPGVVAAFTKATGVKVELAQLRPSEFAPRLVTEQKTGLYAWDVVVGSTSNMNNLIKPAGGFEDLTKYLILPDVTDGKNWRGGKMLYTSADDHFIGIVKIDASDNLYVNTDVLKKLGIESWDAKLLNDPRLKGQMVIRSLTGEHGGSLTFTGIAHKFGKDFAKRILTDMQPQFSANTNLATDQVMKGQKAVVIGAANELVNECWKAGGCKNVVQPRTTLYALPRGISVLKNPPNPNAAKVWVNWYLSKEGQTVAVSARQQFFDDGAHSARSDVPSPQEDSMADFDKLGQYSLQGTDFGVDLMNWVLETAKQTQK